MGQDIFDVIIVLVLTAFAARGFWTGFVGEVAGLISIVGGFWVSHHFHTVLAPHLTFITEPAWRNIASYVLLFLGVLIAVMQWALAKGEKKAAEKNEKEGN